MPRSQAFIIFGKSPTVRHADIHHGSGVWPRAECLLEFDFLDREEEITVWSAELQNSMVVSQSLFDPLFEALSENRCRLRRAAYFLPLPAAVTAVSFSHFFTKVPPMRCEKGGYLVHFGGLCSLLVLESDQFKRWFRELEDPSTLQATPESLSSALSAYAALEAADKAEAEIILPLD